MIRHAVLMKFREGYSQEELQPMIAKMNAMAAGIPQIQSLVHGPEAGAVPGRYDYGLVADFASREDLLAYLAHPLHQELGRDIKAILVDAAPMQFVY